MYYNGKSTAKILGHGNFSIILYIYKVYLLGGRSWVRINLSPWSSTSCLWAMSYIIRTRASFIFASHIHSLVLVPQIKERLALYTALDSRFQAEHSL